MAFVENWLQKLEWGASGLAGYSTTDGGQHLLVAGLDGLVRPLEIGPVQNWQWTWGDPLMRHHDEIVGLAAYYHPGDGAHHLFAALRPGDIWEAIFSSDNNSQEHRENWLQKLEWGASGLAGYSTTDGGQHLLVAGLDGLVRPLEIGPVQNWQ